MKRANPIFAFTALCLCACVSKPTAVIQNTDTEPAGETNKALYLYIDEERLPVSLAENSSTDQLLSILERTDILYTAKDYGGFEKVGDLGITITSNDEQITAVPGDVLLYQGDQLCLYYAENTWSFTRIGKIEGYSTEALKTILNAGQGDIEVRLSTH